jgi:hypothetical protein
MRRQVASLMLCIGMATGCDRSLPVPSAAQLARADCPSVASDDYFFPRDSLALDPTADAFSRRGPSLILAAAREPSLSCGAEVGESYRFVWIHAFDQSHPLIVRAVRVDGEWMITGVELAGPSMRSERVRREHALTDDQAATLVDSLRKADFWAVQGPSALPEGATDGAIWMFEGRRNTAYHVVRRWGVDDGPLMDLGVTLVRLARLTVPDLMVGN